jgi:hypothetical protein
VRRLGAYPLSWPPPKYILLTVGDRMVRERECWGFAYNYLRGDE